MGYDNVFISYKAEEFDEANWVKKTLETNGISCWMAPMSIPGGSSYASEIEHAIKNCKVFVLILSKKAQDSKWVTKELDRALNSEKIIMPFDIENFPLNDAFNFYLTDVQRYEAFSNKSNAVQKMISDIKNVILGSEIQTEQHAAVSETIPAPVSAPVQTAAPTPITTPAPVQASTPVPTPVKTAQVNTVAAPVQKKKSSKKKIAIIIAVIAAVILFSFFGLLLLAGLSSGSDYEEKDGGVLSSTEELCDFCFKLDGVDYQVPFKSQKLINEGWKLKYPAEADYDTLVPGKNYERLTLSKNNTEIEVYAYNDSGNSVAIKDCNIGGISICGNKADFCLENGISTASSVDEILDAFGTPYSHTHYKNSDSDSIIYRINDESNIYLQFNCYNNKEEAKNSSIEIKNFSFTEIDPNETKTEYPSYLIWDVISPVLLGDDITSGNIEIEGAIYSLPTSIKNFTNNGWEILEAPSAIASGGNEFITLKKDGKTIEAKITNFAEYQTIAENCAVTYVKIGDKVNATLAGGPKIGLPKEDADLYSDFTVTKYSSEFIYSFSQYDPYIRAEFSVDKETKKVSELTLEFTEWN